MTYKSPQNVARAARGLVLLTMHPDFGRMTDDTIDELATAASDIIADILHALNTAGLFGNPADEYWPEDLLDRAARSYHGDFEDEETT